MGTMTNRKKKIRTSSSNQFIHKNFTMAEKSRKKMVFNLRQMFIRSSRGAKKSLLA